MEIFKTKDFSSFRTLNGNRPIDPYSLKKLMFSIQHSNQLHLHPIIVNEKMEVIDGQHRLEAAKRLGLEISYIQGEVDDNHVIDSNFNQKSFSTANFVNFFCQRKMSPDYIELQSLLERTGLAPKALLCLCFGVVNNSLLNFLKTGKFQFPKDKSYLRFVDSYITFLGYCKEKRIRPLSMFSHHNFTKAFRMLCSTEGFHIPVLFAKMDLRWFDLKPQLGSTGWYRLLISIYNYRNHNRIAESKEDCSALEY